MPKGTRSVHPWREFAASQYAKGLSVQVPPPQRLEPKRTRLSSDTYREVDVEQDCIGKGEGVDRRQCRNGE